MTADGEVRTPSVPHLREAVAADVPDVVALVESAYRGESSRAGWTTEAHLLDGRRTNPDAVAGVIASTSAQLLLTEDADGPVGCCVLEDHGSRWYFGTFAVRPTAQARGTGSALLAEAERRAVAAGAETLELTVIAQRADLIAWYERRGFVRTGETRPFPYEDQRFGLPRRDDLEFVVLEKMLTSS